MIRTLALGLLLAALAHAQPTVLHNATIYTVDPAAPTAQAMAFEDGRLLAVGSEADVLAAYPDARRLDAGGRTVVPGLIDAHAHLMGLGESLLSADLVGATSRADVVARLQAFAADLPDGAWLTGRGWDQNDWPNTDFPTAADLDAAFPDRPVWLGRIDGHAGWANSAAMRAAGLDPTAAAPAAPEGGAILTDAQGRPTGVFIDAAEALVARAVPAPSSEEVRLMLDRALAETARYGLTGVHEAGVPLSWVRLYQQAIDEGAFGLRLYAMIGGEGETLDHFCDQGLMMDYRGRLSVRSLKLYMDGALGSRGAAMIEPYADDHANTGLILIAPDRFETVVARAMDCGLQVNTHAIGDRANRIVLDAYERLIPHATGNPGRHRIEHAQVVVRPSDIERFAPAGIIASVQPTHATSDMPWAETRVGPDRIRGAYAWRAFLDSGARLVLGSDFPVERVDPILGFYAAVTRQDAEGMPEGGWYPDERLTREEALRGFTLDAAYAGFMEDEVGSLTPGKRADFVVLTQDLMTVPDEHILDTRVVATFLDGRAIYGGLE
jgi:predicted amidohydrolase YtcJ